LPYKTRLAYKSSPSFGLVCK